MNMEAMMTELVQEKYLAKEIIDMKYQLEVREKMAEVLGELHDIAHWRKGIFEYQYVKPAEEFEHYVSLMAPGNGPTEEEYRIFYQMSLREEQRLVITELNTGRCYIVYDK